MNKLKTAFLSMASMLVMAGCNTEQDNSLPANTTPMTTTTTEKDSTIVSEDGSHNTVHELRSYKLDTARAQVILNGRDIYQVDDMNYQTSGYWMQMTEEMDPITREMHVTGVVVSKAADENGDHYLTTDDVTYDPNGWKSNSHTEYRLKGRPEFNSTNRTRLWRVAPVPLAPVPR